MLADFFSSLSFCWQSAAGDQLRVVYEQLSRDPNSLANLDQDLPNYAQHVVPIFSLPQVWQHAIRFSGGWCCGTLLQVDVRACTYCLRQWSLLLAIC